MPIDGVIMLVMLLLGMASSAGLAWCARGTRDRSRLRREVNDWCARERAAMDKTESERVAFWLKKYREIGIGGGGGEGTTSGEARDATGHPSWFRGDGYASRVRLHDDDLEEVHVPRETYDAMVRGMGSGGGRDRGIEGRGIK